MFIKIPMKFKDMKTYLKEDKRLEELGILMRDKTEEQLRIFLEILGE